MSKPRPSLLTREDLEIARAQLVRELIDGNRDEVTLFSPAQVMGLLDINHATLAALPIPRVEIIPRRVIRYRLADVKEFISKHITE
jgi:hypothetical protein